MSDATPRTKKFIIRSLTPATPAEGDYVVGYKPGTGEVVRFTAGDFGVGEGGAVTSVNGSTGEVVITKSSLSLGNVDNTADASKPVSTLQAAADAAVQAAAIQRANHTGTQSADTITDGSTNKAFTAAEKTKLSGIATGATSNSSDATLLARANHTGSQAISTVMGLQAALDGKTDSLGADDNYVTDAEKVKLSNLSGTNTGDQDLSSLAPKASPTFTGTVSGITKSMVGLGSVDNTSDAGKPVSTAQQTALDLKANLASPTFTGTVAGITKSMVGLGNVDNTADASKPVSTAQQTALDLKANLASPTFTGTVGGITKSMVGLGSVDNTSDAGKPVSTAQQTALDLKANLAAPTFTGDAKAVTPSAGDNDTSIATTAFVQQAVPNSSYRTILDCSGSHIAARAAGTYWLGQGDPAGVTGTGTLYPPNIIYIDSSDYPTVDGKAPKLRIRAQVYCNDVAPFTGTFIFGLYPVTRPATSGGAGLCIYTMGTVATGSTVTLTNPAADSSNILVTSDFALPANGHYVIGFVTNQAMAASSHAHISAILQLRNN